MSDLGPMWTDTQAKMEAARCLMCDDPPCVAACPAGVPVKHFIRALRFDVPRRAINLIRERNVLAGVCGLACPVERLCVGACRSTDLSTPIAIGRLQHYAAARALKAGWTERSGGGDGQRVAVVGAGPAGLAAAAELARLGHRPTILERSARAGGICTYGVHSRRAPRALVAGEIEYIRGLGVEIETGVEFGEGRTLDDLLAAGYQAVCVTAGMQEPATPGLRGENLRGVTTWKAVLEAFAAWGLGEGRKPAVPKNVIIIGGGSVAMDTAAAVKDLGAADIDMMCLESPKEMPAYEGELDEAWEAGVRFHTRSTPLRITGKNGRVTGLQAARIRWRRPNKFVPSNAVRIKGTEFWLPASMVIFAIGARVPQALRKAMKGVKFDRAGRIVADPQTGATSRPGVFAAGDAVAGGGTMIVKAVVEGKRVGQAVARYLSGN